MSRLADEHVLEQEHLESDAPRILARLRKAFARHGIIVEGNKFVHAVEQLAARARPQPETPLDAGWPTLNHLDGTVDK